MKNFTLNIWNSKNSVFSVNELSLFIDHNSDKSLRQKISNYLKKWYLEKVYRWLYTIPWKTINPFELANKIYSPSYISLFSALYHHGIIFQPTPWEIYLAYKKSETKKIENLWLIINLKHFKSDILMCTDGLVFTNNYTIASPERAFLDTIYLYDNIYFDNIDNLDQKKLKNLLPIYKRDKMMTNRIKKYFPNI